MRTLGTRRTVTVLMVLAISLTAVPAHAKCKFNVDTIHSRTGEKVLWTKWDTFTTVIIGGTVVGAGVSIGDMKYFALRVDQDADKGELIIPENGKLLILMDDESILELHTEEEVIGDRDPWHVVEAVVKFPLDAATLNALLTKRIMNVRLQTNGGDMDYKFGKKGAKKMQKVLACI